VAPRDLTWKQVVVLDNATEDQYWLNELAYDEVIREVLPSMVKEGLVELRSLGDLIDPSRAEEILGDDRNWNEPEISFYATELGRESYFALGTERLTGLWRDALNEGYPGAESQVAILTWPKRPYPSR
jgi:hypothetical protein